MRHLILWNFIAEKLFQNQPVILLSVVESNGSSPGRQGFKMAVTEDEMSGSIGGGVMEHKFVELAKEKLRQSSANLLLKKQVHQKNSSKDQSGMICSGEQTILLYPLEEKNLPVIQRIISALENKKTGLLKLTFTGFDFRDDDQFNGKFDFDMQSESAFTYSERIGFTNHLYIVGGGHCALALSKLMNEMDFYIHVIEDRDNLNTFIGNEFAHEKIIVKDYSAISKYIPHGDNHYVTIMTFGYRTDDLAVRALMHKKFRYLGVLGSEAKMKRLFSEWRSDKIPENRLANIFSPIGIQIKSETPEEIAVSIAAEIIKVKNEEKAKPELIDDGTENHFAQSRKVRKE
ncbi:hypothetical protein BH11BAC1_BH11BAC1_08780 [soil metagenome]